LARSPLDAWALIDVCHRIRQLIFQISCLPHKTAAVQIFVRATEQIDVLPHHVQHVASGIQSLALRSVSVVGRTFMGSVVLSDKMFYDLVGQFASR